MWWITLSCLWSNFWSALFYVWFASSIRKLCFYDKVLKTDLRFCSQWIRFWGRMREIRGYTHPNDIYCGDTIMCDSSVSKDRSKVGWKRRICGLLTRYVIYFWTKYTHTSLEEQLCPSDYVANTKQVSACLHAFLDVTSKASLLNCPLRLQRMQSSQPFL